MSDFPNRCSCRSRASPRRGIHCLLAGVRSLLADRPGAPRSLRLWALVGRLAVAVVCFAGGLLIAEHFAEGIAVTLLDAGMAWVVIPIAVASGPFSLSWRRSSSPGSGTGSALGPAPSAREQTSDASLP